MITRIAVSSVMLLLVIACAPQGMRDTDLIKSSDINVELGIAYMREGDYQQSMDKLKKALEQNRDNPSAHNALGLLHARLGQAEDAERHFRKAVLLKSDDSSYQVNYGAFLCSRGQIEQAEQLFLQAAGNPLYKTPEYAYTNAGYCLQGKDAEKAESYYRQALQVNPAFPQALYHMANISFKQKKYLRVRAYLQRFSEVSAHTPATLWLGVQSEILLQDRDAAANYGLRLKLNYPDADETTQLLKMEEDERHTRN